MKSAKLTLCGLLIGIYGIGFAQDEALRSKIENAVRPFATIIEIHAQQFAVDPALVEAVITVESNGNPNAQSGAGAMGLMQLMPATCLDYGVMNPFDPEDNIRGGTAVLARHLRKYKGDLTKTLAAYNAGPRHVDDGSWTKLAETRRYVPKVLAHYAAIKPDGDGWLSPTQSSDTPPPMPTIPQPYIPPIRWMDFMFGTLQSSVTDGSQIAENGSLDEVAASLLGSVLDGKTNRSNVQKAAAKALAHTPYASKLRKALCLTTPDAQSFPDAWNAQLPADGHVVGLAHGQQKGIHYWIVVLIEP